MKSEGNHNHGCILWLIFGALLVLILIMSGLAPIEAIKWSALTLVSFAVGLPILGTGIVCCLIAFVIGFILMIAYLNDYRS